MEFRIGDRVKIKSMPETIGTVVSFTCYYPEKEIGVRWDNMEYSSEYQYSMPAKECIEKLTPLELALL